MALAVTVLVRGTLHTKRTQGLAGGQLLEDEAGAIALPTHDRVGLIEVAGVLQAGANGCNVLIKFRELGLRLVGNAERVGRQGEGLSPVAALLRREEDGGDLSERGQRLGVIVLHRCAVNEDEIRVRRTDSLKVGGADRAQDRDITRAIDEVVGDRLLATAGNDADRGHAQGERVVGRRLRERDDAAGVRRQGHFLTGCVGDGARCGGLGGLGCLGGRGRGRLVG